MIIHCLLKIGEKSYDLELDSQIKTIGRSKSCDYTIDDPMLSSEHCQVFIEDNIPYIEDLDSKNGIKLNGIKVFRQRLYLNDVIQVGESQLEINRFKLSEENLKLLSPKNGQRSNIELEIEGQGNKKTQTTKRKESTQIIKISQKKNLNKQVARSNSPLIKPLIFSLIGILILILVELFS